MRLRCEGRFIATFGVGAGAGQTLVRVCPEMRAVLHPWLASTVAPCTQSQFLRWVNIDSSRGIERVDIRRTAQHSARLTGKSR